MPKTYVLVDPHHDYAIRFIAAIGERHGYRPLCVMTGRVPRRTLRAFPVLRGLETVHVKPENLETFGRGLASQREVLGAIPFAESVLQPVVSLLRGLGSTWNEPQVLALLRDKFAVKQKLREMQPALGIGFSRRFSKERGTSFVHDETVPERFVLKPNRGFGNRAVGFFTRRTPPSAIEEFIASYAETEFVLEEYLPGDEYFINGQVDHDGVCTSVAAFAYERVWANGRHVDWLTWKVPHASAEFGVLERYAQAVISALGLRRSPFHLEAKLADGVPQMVEIGARLAGMSNALLCNQLHGGKLDVFSLAADYYLHEGPQPPAQLDWTAYDAQELVYVHGVNFESGLIHSLEGIDFVERHPLFAGWVRRPELGQRLSPTIDMFSAPYCFILRGPAGRQDALRSAAADLRDRLRINASPAPLRKAKVAAVDIFRRGGWRVLRLLRVE